MLAMSLQRAVFYIIIVRCKTSLLMTNGSMIFTLMLEFVQVIQTKGRTQMLLQ